MATKHLCFTCYRRAGRENDRRELARPFDRHSPAVRREHSRLLRGYTGLLKATSDMSIGAEDVQRILGIIAPYLEPVRPFLTLPTRVQRFPDGEIRRSSGRGGKRD